MSNQELIKIIYIIILSVIIVPTIISYSFAKKEINKLRKYPNSDRIATIRVTTETTVKVRAKTKNEALEKAFKIALENPEIKNAQILNLQVANDDTVNEDS